MKTVPIYSVVAYSGTGKTTFLEKLIPILKGRGYKVAVMKHDAHEFEVDKEGKDSWRMSRAGADISIVLSDTHAAYMENRPISCEAMLDKIDDVDVILTEGYKFGNYKKIALYRAAVGKQFPCDITECVAVVTDTPIESTVPTFGFDDTEKVADLIADTL